MLECTKRPRHGPSATDDLAWMTNSFEANKIRNCDELFFENRLQTQGSLLVGNFFEEMRTQESSTHQGVNFFLKSGSVV